MDHVLRFCQAQVPTPIYHFTNFPDREVEKYQSHLKILELCFIASILESYQVEWRDVEI